MAGPQPFQPSTMAGAQSVQPSSGAWLVIIRWQPSAAPATRTNGCALAAPGLAGRLPLAAIELSPAMALEDGWLQSLCPSHSRWLKWLKWLSPSHLTQDGCDVASSAKRAHLEAGGNRYGCGSASPAMSTKDGCRVCVAAIGLEDVAALQLAQPSLGRWL